MTLKTVLKVRSLAKVIRRHCVRMLLGHGDIFTASKENAVIVVPHPDDEVFGCGGLIAMKKKLGARVTLLMLTDGEAAHRSCCATDPSLIGHARRKLAEESACLLGLSKEDLIWIGLPDGAIPEEGVFEFRSAVERIAENMVRLQPAEVYAPVPFDCWPDHRRTYVLTEAVLTRMADTRISVYCYAIWMWWNLRFRDLRSINAWKRLCLDIDSAKRSKLQAINTYMLAINPRCRKPYCGNLPAGFVSQFKRYSEIYFLPPAKHAGR